MGYRPTHNGQLQTALQLGRQITFWPARVRYSRYMRRIEPANANPELPGKPPIAADSLRASLLSAQPLGLEKSLQTLRLSLIDQLITGIFVVAIVGTPMSVSRSLSTGWMPLYTFHVALALAVVGVFLARRRLSDSFKIAVVLGSFWTVGVVGLFTLGLVGAGYWWLVVSSLLVSLLYSVRAGVLMAAVVLVLIIIAAMGFIQGWLTLPLDANTYIRSPTAWITLAIATSLMPLMIFRAIAALHATTIGLLRKLDEQRQAIALLATHDELTGVPTMTLAMDRLTQAVLSHRRDGEKVAVFFIDLDGFKSVNDAHGHAAGDHALRTTVQRLQAVMRAEDTLARIGGDEFLAIHSGIPGALNAIAIARKLVACLTEPMTFEGQSITVGASIGIALSPDHGTHANELIRAADAAMYDAKRAGRNGVELAKPEPGTA